MNSSNRHAEAAAIENLRRSIASDARLPANVFIGHWQAYRFFVSDNMFSQRFVAAVKLLLPIEGSKTVCIANLDRIEANRERGAVAFLDENSDANAYRMRMLDLDVGFVGRERFGSSSDVGSWCAYCENMGDAGVLAIRDVNLAARLEPALRVIWAKPFQSISDAASPDGASPFINLIPAWREGLSKNFR